MHFKAFGTSNEVPVGFATEQSCIEIAGVWRTIQHRSLSDSLANGLFCNSIYFLFFTFFIVT